MEKFLNVLWRLVHLVGALSICVALHKITPVMWTADESDAFVITLAAALTVVEFARKAITGND
jgi:hypothetical protein